MRVWSHSIPVPCLSHPIPSHENLVPSRSHGTGQWDRYGISRSPQSLYIDMQIKSPINRVLTRDQLAGIQHELSELNSLSSSTATRSRFQRLQRLCRMI